VGRSDSSGWPTFFSGTVDVKSPLFLVVVLSLIVAACGPPPAEPLPPDSFAFGVFGDGPYYPWEQGRFKRVLSDVSEADIEWLLHVGDILWAPCSDEAFEGRLADLNAVAHPVVYTPGDNEWTDCHEVRPGGYEPLDRLAAIRRIFFDDPALSLGALPMRLESQSQDSLFAEFPENARWARGGFVFITIHAVGSGNASDDFSGRTRENDEEVRRRSEAALSWLDGAFAVADETSAKGVVVAVHGNLGIGPDSEGYDVGHEAFVDRLTNHVDGFSGVVLLIHGDSHVYRVDQPLTDQEGRIYANFTRLETMGSPDIGWVRVVVDTVAGQVTSYERRRMLGWW